MMHFFRRFGAPLLAITVLVSLSIFTIVSRRDGFKFMVLRMEDVTLRKRDGTTITFSLPWKSSIETPPKAKALSPVFDGLLADVTDVASTILDDGSGVANNVASQGKALQPMAAGPTQVSVVFDGGAGIVASILSEVNSIVNDAPGVIGGVVGDATSVLGMIIGGVTSTSNDQNTAASNTLTSTSEPQEFLPQSHGTTAISATLSAVNITSPASLPATRSPSDSLGGAPCPAMASTTIKPCCPDPSTTTVTCTVTETWHSTHYESTQTLYSFMSIFTVTCTEIGSVYPPSNPYLFSPNTTTPSSSNPSLAACANGVLVKREEDCPPHSITSKPANMSAPCSMNGAGSTLYSTRNPIPSVASLLSNAGGNLLSNSGPTSTPSTMASFTASLPSLISSAIQVSMIASLIASIVCADGSLVMGTQDCLNDLPGSKTSSLLAFRTSPAPVVSQATAAAANEAGPGNGILSSMVANIVSALSNVQGLTGNMLSTVIADFTSAIQAANTLTRNPLPTGGALAVAGPGATAAAGNILSSITGEALAVTGANVAAGGVVETISEAANAVAGSGIASAGNVLGHLETVVNGIPTLLPVVNTILNGLATTVPVVDMVVNGQPTVIPVVNDGADLLAGLNGGGLVKGRRRIVNRAEASPPQVQYYCEKNPDGEPCLLYGNGGGLMLERALL